MSHNLQLKQVGVVGLGRMGRGIAQVSALAGYTVKAVDQEQDLVDRGLELVGSSLQRMVQKGSLRERERDDILSRINGTKELEPLSDCDLIIEAVFEDLEVKKTLFRQLVSCQLSIVGYSLASLIRALSVVNCQLTLDSRLFRWACQANTSRRTFSISEIRRFRHCLLSTFNSISAMFNQLPCFGVKTNSNRSHRAFACLGGKVSYKAPGLCVLRLSMTKVIFSASS